MPDPQASWTADLAELPTQLARSISLITRGNEALLQTSVGRLGTPQARPPGYLFLRQAQFRSRFYLAKRGRRVVFFFLRRQLPAEVVLDTEVSATLSPDSPLAAQKPTPPPFVRQTLVLPRFLILRPSAVDLEGVAPAGASPTDTLLLKVGRNHRDSLAFVHPELGVAGGQLRYAAGAFPSDVEASQDGLWPVAPFLALVETIRDWVQTGFAVGTEVPFEAPPAHEPSEPRRLLQHLIQAYRDSEATLASALEPADTDWRQPLRCRYTIRDYQARIVLRLKPDGTLAATHADDPFQLELQLSIVPRSHGVTAMVSLGPPDFLIAGGLHQAFLTEVRAAINHRELAARLGVPLSRAAEYWDASAPNAAVFRIRREATQDTNLAIVHGSCQGIQTLLLLRGQFSVQAKTDPPTVRVRDLAILHAGPTAPASRGFETSDVRYFFRLAAELKNWRGVLP